MESIFLRLGKSDLFKGFIMAIGTAIATALIPILQSGTFPDMATLVNALVVGVTAGLVYLLKNLFTNSQGETFKSEPK